MAKNLYFSKLLDFYSSVLKERQKEVMNLYYNKDFSLSEIADNIGISKQGVRDIIKRSELLLLECDANFNIIKKTEYIQKNLEEILIACETLKKCIVNNDLKNLEKNVNLIEEVTKKSLQNNF